MKFSIKLSAMRVAAILAIVSFALAFVSLGSQVDRLLDLGITGSSSLFPLFFLAREGGIATWYSSLLLLYCSVLLAILAVASNNAGNGGHRYWAGLSVVFLYLSADEGAEIHERLVPLGRTILEAVGLSATGALSRAWVVPAMIAVLFLAAIYARFFFRLPSRTRLLFLASGVVFIGGAVGVEMLFTVYVNFTGGLQNTTALGGIVLRAIPNTEELLEMLGVVIFAHALMSYMRDAATEVKLHFE